MVSQRVAGVPPVVATGEPEGWEIIFSVYTMISLQSESFLELASTPVQINSPSIINNFQLHPWWQSGSGWKTVLNNLRLIIQPLTFLALILPWLSIFDFPQLYHTLSQLLSFMNQFHAYVPSG